MKIWQTISSWFANLLKDKNSKALPNDISCTHNRKNGPFEIEVLGIKCVIKKSPMCQSCTNEYLNRFSTICASCKKPIFPGTQIATAWIGAPYRFTHMYTECCESGALYCGQWGENCHITLHDLYPDVYTIATFTIFGHVQDSKTPNGHIQIIPPPVFEIQK